MWEGRKNRSITLVDKDVLIKSINDYSKGHCCWVTSEQGKVIFKDKPDVCQSAVSLRKS